MAKRFKIQQMMVVSEGKPQFEDWRDADSYTDAKKLMIGARGSDGVLKMRMVDTEGEHPAEVMSAAAKAA